MDVDYGVDFYSEKIEKHEIDENIRNQLLNRLIA